MKHLSIPKLPISSLKRYVPKWSHTLVFCIVTSATIGILYLSDSFLRVKRIYVISPRSNNQIHLEQIAQLSMLFNSEAHVKQLILESNPLIHALELTKQYPDTLLLSAQWYQPVAKIKVVDGYYLVSGEGVIVRKSKLDDERDGLPVISYYQQFPFSEFQAGERILAKDINDALLFYVFLRRKGYVIQYIDIRGFHMLGLYSQTQEFIFSSVKGREEQEYQFVQSSMLLKQHGKTYKSIDLRFDKPIVVLL